MLKKTITLSALLMSPLSYGEEIASQVFNITESGQGSIGYLPFTLSSAMPVDIATSGPTIDPEIYLFSGTGNFTSSIAGDDDGCDQIDCGAAGINPEYNSLINDMSLSPGTYTVAVSDFSFSESDAILGTKVNDATGEVLVMVGDSDMIIPGTGTGTGSARLVSFAGGSASDGKVIGSSQIEALTSNMGGAAASVNDLCGSASTHSLIADCAAIAGLSPAAQAVVLEQITPEEINAIGATTVATSSANFSSIQDRITTLKTGGGGGFNIAGLNVGAASSDDMPELFKRLGVFVNIEGGFGDKNKTLNEQGYKFDTQGVTVGADYALTDSFFVGVAFNNTHNKARFLNGAGELYTASYTGSVYGNYNIDDFYIDAIASVGGLDYESERHMSFFNRTAKGTTTGMQYASGISAGYNYRHQNFIVSPYVGFDYTKTEVDGFRENNGVNFAVNYGQQDIESIITKVGARSSYTHSASWGVVTPQLNLEWVHESSYNASLSQVQFVQSTTSFGIRSDAPDRDYMQLGFNVAGQFADGLAAFVAYNTMVDRQNVTNHAFATGVRLEF
jgi:uncharacterized protein with beta-barrel porin domain